jgi:peroxiredoxin
MKKNARSQFKNNRPTLSNESRAERNSMSTSCNIVKPRIFVACFIVVAVLLLSCSAEKNQRIKIGDTITPFTARDINGTPINLDDYKGSPVILRFFLIDCKFCIADTPAFNAYFEKHRQDGLKIIYINNDAPDIRAVRDFVEKLAIPFPVVADPAGRIAAQYNVKIQPLTMMLDPEHRLLAAVSGGVSEAELADIMGPYLRKKEN